MGHHVWLSQEKLFVTDLGHTILIFAAKFRVIVTTPTQPQLINSTNTTKVGFDTKINLQTTPPHHPPQKLNVNIISAVTDLILPSSVPAPAKAKLVRLR